MRDLITFTGHGTYAPSGKVDVSPERAEEINRAVDAADVAEWSSCPDLFSPAYYHFPMHQGGGRYRDAFTVNTIYAHVTTFQGSKLGRIVDARVYRHNFGGRMVSLRVLGSNGAMYYGRASWDNGQIVRLRKCKRVASAEYRTYVNSVSDPRD